MSQHFTQKDKKQDFRMSKTVLHAPLICSALLPACFAVWYSYQHVQAFLTIRIAQLAFTDFGIGKLKGQEKLIYGEVQMLI